MDKTLFLPLIGEVEMTRVHLIYDGLPLSFDLEADEHLFYVHLLEPNTEGRYIDYYIKPCNFAEHHDLISDSITIRDFLTRERTLLSVMRIDSSGHISIRNTDQNIGEGILPEEGLYLESEYKDNET